MTRPSSDQFVDFFAALHGVEPFPWQRRLAASVVEHGRWPNLLDVPTGLGKTSAIDVALFALAVRPELAARRIVLVVDRRIVVDQAADHARKIQRRLANAAEGILREVARALRELWDGTADAEPFEVAVLRGGMPRDEAWAHRPDRPVVALSTVDQVGSRLLFRGYGVSAGMTPVHAGLLGCDALILLDEVQLSTAFAQTLRAVEERWRPWRDRDDERIRSIPDRWSFVRMSATPVTEPVKGHVPFTLDVEDHAHPIVKRRLRASKTAKLADPIATSKSDAEKSRLAVVEAFAKESMRFLDAGRRRVAVIVNRVATAREIHSDLTRRAGERADVVLLTGRMRPLDRDEIFGATSEPSSVAARVIAGGARSLEQRPVILVSTQTIEAGADFDFDALVTECASIDALRQRFGRLDRRGDLERTQATILIRKDQLGESDDDPVYGAALGKTWNWLEAKSDGSRCIDFGTEYFPPLPSAWRERSELCSPVRHAPVLLPAHLDAWAQTNPRERDFEPDVALWLHGPLRGLAEVRVVWRADLTEALLGEERGEEYASAALALAPPSSLETISVPLPAFRAWLAGRPGVELADVEGADSSVSQEQRSQEGQSNDRPFVIAGRAQARIQRDSDHLYPDATVVVPANYGGIRHGNWDPSAREPVRDLGDLAQLLHHGRPVLRLVPGVLCAALSVPNDASQEGSENGAYSNAAETPRALELPAIIASSVPRAPGADDADFKPSVAVGEWLDGVRGAGSSLWRLVVESLTSRTANRRVIQLGDFFGVTGKRLPPRRIEAYRRHIDPTSDIVNDDDDNASYLGQEVGLEQHLADVERWARAFARNVGLSETIASDLVLAAHLHDIGKADPRFQQMLHGGSAVHAAGSPQLLAKSRGEAGDWRARDHAQKRADYPSGYRHELLSVAMLESNRRALERANDPDLVLHLIGSHHGWCRPFAPARYHGPALTVQLSLDGELYSADAAHGLASLDSGVADRYWVLTERYGWWTLAWLEGLVRLADHRASEERARTEAGQDESRSTDLRVDEEAS